MTVTEILRRVIKEGNPTDPSGFCDYCGAQRIGGEPHGDSCAWQLAKLWLQKQGEMEG